MCSNKSNNYNTNLLTVSLEQSYALNRQIEKFRKGTYPSVKLEDFVEELYKVNNAFIKLFYNLNSDNLTSTQIRLLDQIFSFFMNEIASTALYADVHQNPLEMMIPVKELIQKLNVDVDFITVPSWKINYAIGDVWNLFNGYINFLKTQDPNMNIKIQDKKIIQIVFPIVHKDNILLGGILGHEFGHYLDKNFKKSLITQKILLVVKNYNRKSELIKYLDYDKALNLNPQALSLIIDTLLTKVSMIECWIQEFVADIIGIFIYGISSYFSCEKVFMYQNISEKDKLIDRFSATHPRCSARSTVRLEVLKHLDYENILDPSLVKIIKDFHSSWINANIEPYDQVHIEEFTLGLQKIKVNLNLNVDSCKLIEQILLDNIKEIIKIVETNIPAQIKYNFSDIKDKSMPLAKKIANLIPPNELSKIPMDSMSIMNAGWIAYYLYINDIKKFLSEYSPQEQDIKAIEMINSLMSKALVSSHIHRRWNACS